MEFDSSRSEEMPKAPDDPVGKMERRPYRAPKLVEWGLIEDLTRGQGGGTQDPDFTGTETFF